MTTTIQATQAVLPEPFKVGLETFSLPQPGPDQVLVETEASAISAGTELAIYTGIHQWLADPTRSWPKFPFVPGYSGVGRILAAGENCRQWQTGDRVVFAARHASHALINVADQNAVIWPIGSDVSASAAACAVLMRFPLTALVRAESMLGQSVAVLGLGMIGQLTLRLFAAAGAYPLIGIDPLAGRRELAERTYGVSTVDPDAGELKTALRGINNGSLPDIVVDATGAPPAVRSAMAVVADGGKVIMVGSPRGIAGEVDFYWDLHGRSISLIGAHGSAIGVEPREKFPFVRDRALRLLAHMLESGRVAVDDLITHHVYTGELRDMYEGLLHKRDEYLGVTLHWQS